MTSPHFSAQGLLAAWERIRQQVHQTPVLTSRSLDQLSGAQLFFKCENLQKVGAFKYRGASHVLSLLSPEVKARGVLTHSSGNHAQALALAAREQGLQAWIVMPENAPAVKRAAVAGYGAEIISCEASLTARESTAQAVQARTGAVFVHPYDDPRIIAGQASAGLELLAQSRAQGAQLELILAPVGGGGLLSGIALAAHHHGPGVSVWGAEPAGADDAARSLAAGKLLPSEHPQTLADGLLTSLGQWTFPLIQAHVPRILTVSEASILQALRLLWERMKLVVEPSGAVPLAAVLQHPEHFAGRQVGLVLSGGNVDLAQAGHWFS